MLFEFNPQSAFLLIPFLMGLVFTFLFLIRGFVRNEKTDWLLGTFVLLSSLFISPWMFGFAGWYNNQPYRDILFYLPLQNLLFFGPIVIFYTKKLLYPRFISSLRDYLHYLPGTLYLIYTLYMFLADKFIHGTNFYYADGSDKDFDVWYQFLGFLSMGIYSIFSIKEYSNFRKISVQLVSFADTILHRWTRNFLFAFLTMISLKIMFLGLTIIYPQLDSYIGNWWFYISFAIVLFYICIHGFSEHDSIRLSYGWERYRAEFESYQDNVSETSNVAVKIDDYANDDHRKVEIMQLKDKVQRAMELEKP